MSLSKSELVDRLRFRYDLTQAAALQIVQGLSWGVTIDTLDELAYAQDVRFWAADFDEPAVVGSFKHVGVRAVAPRTCVDYVIAADANGVTAVHLIRVSRGLLGLDATNRCRVTSQPLSTGGAARFPEVASGLVTNVAIQGAALFRFTQGATSSVIVPTKIRLSPGDELLATIATVSSAIRLTLFGREWDR